MLSAGIFTTSVAIAQTPAPDQAAAPVEEIVVTARKVSEKIQDVPIAVSAFTAQDIEEQGLTDLNDIANFTPGVSFEDQFGRRDTTFNTVIRGISSISNAAVTFKSFANFVDGVYIPGSLESFDLSDVERVELIKGPQAALYGRATESGAINYVTKKPTDSYQFEGAVSGAMYNTERVSARVSGPIAIDKVYFSVNASYYNRGGEYRNLFDGQRDDTENTKTIAGAVRFTPIDDLDIMAKINLSEDQDGPPAIGWSPATRDNCYLAVYPYYCGVIEATKFVNINTAIPEYYGLSRKTVLSSLIGNYSLGDYTLTSTTGYGVTTERIGEDQSYDAFLENPYSGLPADAFIDSFKDDDWNVSQELRLTSPRDEPLRFQAGAYYYYEKYGHRDVQADFDLLPSYFGGYGQLNYYHYSVRDDAIFGQIEYDILPNLTASAEIRLQEDAISYEDDPGFYAQNARYYAANPRFVLTYKVDPDVLTYVSVSKGTKPGGFNSPGTPNDSFSEEKNWAYEIGAKTSWLDRRLTFNIDGFYNSITNEQLTATYALSSGLVSSYNVNAGKAHTDGIEMETDAKVTDELSFRLTWAFTITELDDFQGFADLCNLAGQYTPDYIYYQGPVTNASCLAGPVGNAKGKQLPNAPRNQASLQVNWIAPLTGDWKYFVRPSYSYKSSVFDESENLTKTGDHHIVNLRLGVTSGPYTITAFGTNLLGDGHANYILRYVDFSSFNYAFFGNDRGFAYALPERLQVGLEARAKF